MPVDVQKAATVHQMLEASINVMKAANSMLTGAQDPAVLAFSQSNTGAIDLLTIAFRTLGEILVQLADEAEKMRNDGSAMHAATLARIQEEADWAAREQEDEDNRERARYRRGGPFA